ncbi:cysteine ase [Pyrenophora seminiperda CCB06]|uniref:Cysteine ase n=1 Tax=Pyrenophora seminiperda CCB06 TaxID=1302712 RepID=A0A3M7MDI7_9PLEO|nr:cysteine ase [Pyrenophora seminiperda CCB06]
MPLCGHQELHKTLRAATIEHMKENADFYRQYMVVNSVRRNPKRKTAAAARVDTGQYSDDQLQLQFEEHVEKMGQPGEWADNMEVSAFASALNVHVRLWQADFSYLVSPRDYYSSGGDVTAEDTRQTLHIAYHTWEHYSSVRNLAGPHTGPPNVTVVPKVISKKRPSPSVDGDDDDQHRRARKRRSPVYESDFTPEGTAESSSDESNGVAASQQANVKSTLSEPMKPRKLTIKLRCLRTSDASTPASSRPSSRAATPAPRRTLSPKSKKTAVQVAPTPTKTTTKKTTVQVAPTPTKTTIRIGPKKILVTPPPHPIFKRALVTSPLPMTPKKNASVASPTSADATPKRLPKTVVLGSPSPKMAATASTTPTKQPITTPHVTAQ